MRGSEERGAEKLMDDYLKSIGLHRKSIAKDGSCLFRAVAEQVLHCQNLHTEVRAKCVEYLKQHRDSYEAFIEGNFEDYLRKLQDPQQWVGEVEINALAVMYKRDFLIYQEPGKSAVNITGNNFKEKVQLCFLNGNHYDSVYPISRVRNAALCQSILYELLYDDVLKADRGALASCQRSSRASDLLSDDSMAACASSDESDLDAGEPPWVENGTSTSRHNNQNWTRGRGRGRLLLPERVRRALNPTLYRNVEYDVWQKTKKAQQKMDYCIAAGMQYTVGDRCQVRLEGHGRSYSATIKEVAPSSDLVTVYGEEIGKLQVHLWNLRPPSDESSGWSTVANRDKRLSNGHGEWEEKGRGRGRAKTLPASSTVAQVTAAGSSGRVQKQNSWPPHAAVEDQGGSRASRKSGGQTEAVSFGLTEEERLAREEEERNVALVEIQLRDEHSFPALGTQPGVQGEGGRRKVGEKKRSQRNKTKSPVEDASAPSPSAGERPKSSTPPLAAATAPTPPTDPDPPAAPPSNADRSPTWLSSLKASPPNMAAVAAAAAGPSLPLTCAAAADKPSAPSYASAACAAASSPPAAAAAALSSKPSPHSFLTPVLPAASSPLTPPTLSTSSSSLPPPSSASPLSSSSRSTPTFIAPIAPPATAAQGFLARSSPPVSSLHHSPSPPAHSPSSSSFTHPKVHAPQVREAPPAPAQTPHSLPKTGASLSQESLPQSPVQQQTATQSSLPVLQQQPLPHTEAAPVPQSQISVSQPQTQTTLTQIQSQTPVPQNQIQMPQVQTAPQSSATPLQQQPQSHTEAASVPQNQTQMQACIIQLSSQSQAQYLPESQSHLVQAQSGGAAPGQPQPPHPSQVPLPSLSASPTHSSLQTQTPVAQNHPEAPPPAAQQPEPPAHPSPQQSHPPQPSHHPQLPSLHPPPPQHLPPIPGAVPLQQLSQLYQDLLYPGFPQGEKGDVAPTPPYSSSRSGEDLPHDVSILRFFFNLGVKAYTMPMYQPYVYLFPLQQAYTMHPRLPSCSPPPPPHYLPSNPPSRHQEVYPQPQYPPSSASVVPQYDHHVAPQPPATEPPQPSEPTRYPITQAPPHRMPCPMLPWQHHQLPPLRNPSYPMGYATPSPPYSAPPPSSQGYHPGQGSGHPLYPPSVPPYPPPALRYPPSASTEELQVSQGVMEQLHPSNGGTMPGHGPGRVPGSTAANPPNNRASVAPGAFKNEQGENLMLLVDPPINNIPVLTLVPQSEIKDVSVPMTTRPKPGSAPGSPAHYDVISKRIVAGDNNLSRIYTPNRKPAHPTKAYGPAGPQEVGQAGFMAEQLSVGCNTEEWAEPEGFKPSVASHRGARRGFRGGGRGRGGQRRRQGSDAGAGYIYSQYNPSYEGRGRERRH